MIEWAMAYLAHPAKPALGLAATYIERCNF